MRRTKIIATLGPASRDQDSIEALIDAGLNTARLNFSHGNHDDHRRTFAAARAASAKLNRPLAILQDLQGPKIRVGKLLAGKMTLVDGQWVHILVGEHAAAEGEIPCTYGEIVSEARPGDQVLLDDGRLVLRAEHRCGDRLRCQVETGGVLSDHKGINLPGVPLSTPALTAKDCQDLQLGRELGVDYVALSFVRSADDVVQAQKQLGNTPLIAKIEKPEALEQIEAIVRQADGIMVARGDLGVELGPERVPMLQKQLIDLANAHGKLVITATEMLDSMRTNSRPTRAEVSDVANAVLDGTDAVMLSGETAVGVNPAAAVLAMHHIVCETEGSTQFRQRVARPPESLCTREATNAIARAAVAASSEIQAAAIICYTESGAVALMTSEYRPQSPLIAVTEHRWLVNRLALHWGVTPLLVQRAPMTTEETVNTVIAAARQANLVQAGDNVVVVCGSRRDGPSDVIKIEQLA